MLKETLAMHPDLGCLPLHYFPFLLSKPTEMNPSSAGSRDDRAKQQKVIMIGIITVLVLLILLILYSKFF